MWAWRILPLILVVANCQNQSSSGVADVLSNYARVAVNQFLPKTTELTPSTTEKNNATSSNDDEDSAEDYDDFDDMTATEQPKSPNMDGQSMLKYVSGLINLMALMARFGDKPKSEHFTRKRLQTSGRNAEGDPLAQSINGLSVAEDRYNPTTATKKFKYGQGGYPPLAASPVYVPSVSAPADSYAPTGGKTSYDSDANEFMVSNDMNNPTSSMKKPKPPMNDYISQNDPAFDIRPSYSYQLPSEAVNSKPMNSKPGYSYVPPESSMQKPSMPAAPSGYPWNMKHEDSHDDRDEENEEKPMSPVYYPWSKRPKQPVDYDNGDEMDTQPKSPKQQIDYGHYPYKSPPKKVKPAAIDYEDEAPSPPWGMKSPPRGKPPKDMEPEDDIPEEEPVWHNKPKPGDDHVYPYPLYHDHGLLYPGDDDHHHDHDDDDHDMKDEDRESKRPYTYYHLGRKLWYVPLLFSLYFIVYVAALLLKSIAKHKVQFPEKLWDIHGHHDHHGHDRNGRNLDGVTENVLTSIDKAENKFM